jgi:transposase
MARNIFREYLGNQTSLFPENILDRIALNHPVRLVNEVVDNLDITPIIENYKGGGASSFHPRMMIKVLFFTAIYAIHILVGKLKKRSMRTSILFGFPEVPRPTFGQSTTFGANACKDR